MPVGEYLLKCGGLAALVSAVVLVGFTPLPFWVGVVIVGARP